MNRILGGVLVALVCWLGVDAEAQRKKVALTWWTSVEAAKEEARLRNVPIVLHIHGNT